MYEVYIFKRVTKVRRVRVEKWVTMSKENSYFAETWEDKLSFLGSLFPFLVVVIFPFTTRSIYSNSQRLDSLLHFTPIKVFLSQFHESFYRFLQDNQVNPPLMFQSFLKLISSSPSTIFFLKTTISSPFFFSRIF